MVKQHKGVSGRDFKEKSIVIINKMRKTALDFLKILYLHFSESKFCIVPCLQVAGLEKRLEKMVSMCWMP